MYYLSGFDLEEHAEWKTYFISSNWKTELGKMKSGLLLLSIWLILLNNALDLSAQVYLTQSGEVSFISEAPLELIRARSQELRGAIDTDKHTFAFNLRVISFEGFNSALQREHFNEKFLETNSFPKATFQGKLIEKIDFSAPGIYPVRAKGIFEVHGIPQERIIRATIEVKESGIELTADFKVLVADHKITIPQIVYQNIAEEIQVKVKAVLKKQKS
jgi:polyisoprenoid-binding protein YceI